MMRSTVPVLTGDAAAAAAHRGSHLQIIACAGSGKTEVVSQRVAGLLAEGIDPASIVAFTFTERAAAELKERIGQRAEGVLGEHAQERLGPLFVGTIHAYSFRLLQRYVPEYETYDVLDAHQLTAFLHREAHRLNIKSLRADGRLFASIEDFSRSIDVVENELIDPADLQDPFASVYRRYLETLRHYRLLTFGQQISRAVSELGEPEVLRQVQADLRHLVVDEYQDVNPAQERLVRLLTEGAGAELCVVGDDDQAIYQWRGSSVANIVTFADRYPGVARFELLTNRRSREGIVTRADRFAATINGRLPKSMLAVRPDERLPVVRLAALPSEAEEAEHIAASIEDLHTAGVPYRDIAILARKRAAFPALIDALEHRGIPVQAAGRTGLFETTEGDILGRFFAWLADIDWRSRRFAGGAVTTPDLMTRLTQTFGLTMGDVRAVGRLAAELKAQVPRTTAVDLVGIYYRLLNALRVDQWDLSDPLVINRMGTLARFSAVIADYEKVRRRARRDPSAPGTQVGGELGGTWYYRNFALYLVNYATTNYEGFDGEPEPLVDAVDMLTVHGAKGLEWPVVFIPSATRRRFDHAGNPRGRPTLVPDHLYDADRYHGSDDDERRLFYVAMTRARDLLHVSRHERVKTQSVGPSAYFTHLQRHVGASRGGPVLLQTATAGDGDPEQLRLTYSDVAAFLACGHAYRLRTRLGFLPPLAAELGYGRAVHHLMRSAADATAAAGRPITPSEAHRLVEQHFYLPAANKAAHAQMKGVAEQLLLSYLADPEYRDELTRTWQSERPFELHLPTVVVTGRADVIFSDGAGTAPRLTLVDYKTSTSGNGYDLQLQIYADAGQREGLTVDRAFVHDLKRQERTEVTIDRPHLRAAEQTVQQVAERLRASEFEPARDTSVCRKCDVRMLCGSRAA